MTVDSIASAHVSVQQWLFVALLGGLGGSLLLRLVVQLWRAWRFVAGGAFGHPTFGRRRCTGEQGQGAASSSAAGCSWSWSALQRHMARDASHRAKDSRRYAAASSRAGAMASMAQQGAARLAELAGSWQIAVAAHSAARVASRVVKDSRRSVKSCKPRAANRVAGLRARRQCRPASVAGLYVATYLHGIPEKEF